MKHIKTIVFIIASLFIVCGVEKKPSDVKANCPKNQATKSGQTDTPEPKPLSVEQKVTLIKNALALEKIHSNSVKIKDNDVIVSYEASQATEYDLQINAHWATIFGVCARFAQQNVNIENTAGGEPLMTLTASTENIQKMLSKHISVEDFLNSIIITAAN